MRRLRSTLARVIPGEPWLFASAAVISAACVFALSGFVTRNNLPSLAPYGGCFVALSVACILGAILTLPKRKGQ